MEFMILKFKYSIYWYYKYILREFLVTKAYSQSKSAYYTIRVTSKVYKVLWTLLLSTTIVYIPISPRLAYMIRNKNSIIRDIPDWNIWNVSLERIGSRNNSWVQVVVENSRVIRINTISSNSSIRLRIKRVNTISFDSSIK